MTRTDTTVVGALVVLLALDRGPRRHPGAAPRPRPRRSPTGPSYAPARAYREGVVGHPASVSPLTARTQADRDLVALVFSGLVRNGPNGTIVPGPRRAAGPSTPTGKTWTFDLRPDARWHDGEPVTADDVVYTIQTLQDPAYKGPASTSWSEVSVEALSPLEVTFTLTTPLGGFLQAATQPIAPAHLLGQVPVDLLPDHPFGQAAGRLRSVRARQPRRHARRARPGRGRPAGSRGERRPVGPRDRFAHDRGPDRSPRAPDARTSPASTCASTTTRTSSSPPIARATSTRRPACRPRRPPTSRRCPTAGSCATRAPPSRRCS